VAKPPTDRVIAALLERHGQTYVQELGIDVAKGTPSVLFRLLVASILFSARIGAGQAANIADHTCSATTLRRRRDEWISAGLAEQLRLLVLGGYDRLFGLQLE
jgi:hypothetical protein